MAWFAAVTYPSALGPSPSPAPGAVELSFEGGWVPTLSARQRTVGFLGTKPEDLNRTSVVGRPRLAIGLPGSVTATLGWMPPAEVDGVKPDLLSLALGRPLWQGERATVGARLLAERGTLTGDLTCPRAAVAAGHDAERNPYDCESPSRDTMRIRLWGVELQAGTTLRRYPRLTPYVTVAASRLHAEFQVSAHYRGLLDRTFLHTDGTVWSASAGLSAAASDRVRVAGELFYAPLDVVRGRGARSERDALLNGRLLLAYRLR